MNKKLYNVTPQNPLTISTLKSLDTLGLETYLNIMGYDLSIYNDDELIQSLFNFLTNDIKKDFMLNFIKENNLFKKEA